MHSQFGSKVIPLGKPDEEGWIKVKRVEDQAIREWHISQLKADNEEDLRLLCEKR